MFVSHLAVVDIKRIEPSNLDLDGIVNKVLLERESLAERIIISSWVNGDNRKAKKVISKKISEIDSLIERKQFVSQFMEIWNYWRMFYFDLNPIRPKTKSQLTQIENAVNLVKEKDLQLNLVIACTHKAFVWRKVNPAFHNLINAGLEKYDQYIDDVMVDIDRSYRDSRAEI